MKISKKYINKFSIAIAFFVLWILFIDVNSLFFQQGLNKEIKKLEEKKAFYQKEIQKKKQELKDLKDEKKLEKYGREKLLLKKKDEDIYLIDSKEEK